MNITLWLILCVITYGLFILYNIAVSLEEISKAMRDRNNHDGIES